MTARPTHALIRSVLVATTCLVLAVLNQQPLLTLLAAPFLAYNILAARRPHVSALDATDVPRLLRGGDSTAVGLRVQAEDQVWISVRWQTPPGILMEPTAQTGPGPSITTVALPPRWGTYKIQPESVTIHDVWGAWRLAPDAYPSTTLRIVPQTAPLRTPDGISTPTGTSGPHESRHQGDGAGISDLREFRSGDRTRRINWHATARHGTPYVTTGYREEDTDILLCLDTTSDIPCDDPNLPSSLDRTMSALAAITRHCTLQGDRVAVLDRGTVIGSIPAGTGLKHAQRVTGAITRASLTRWTPTLRPLPTLHIKPGTLTFVVSPFIKDEIGLDSLALQRRGCDIVAIDTFPTQAGRLQAADWRRYRGEFTAEATALLRLNRTDIGRAFARRGIPLVSWTDETSLAAVMRQRQATRRAPIRRRS